MNRKHITYLLLGRMGLNYTDLVVACPKCLDSLSGFEDGVDFTKLKDTEAGLLFKELVLRSFSDFPFKSSVSTRANSRA